jgi:uncharacterized protein YdiU (UPF0061 family)
MTISFPFDNSYARLPEGFFARVEPTPATEPSLIKVNEALALELGLDPDALASAEGIDILAGRRLPSGAEPIATAYAGHQFGQFVPQLGDGRAILLGEVVDRNGLRRDIQLKGAGRTPFSRRGDGRAALGPVLREYIVSEAIAALGIPTTRALAAVTTGDEVIRDALLPGAVLTRVASSHIRVGTFQYLAARGDEEGLAALTAHVIARHYPEAADAERPALALLESVIAKQTELVARWLGVGFIHGVMNTDNMSVAGETIDYGPCAFLDVYDPDAVFSSIDHGGRYAYSNQPRIAQWNLARLAEALLPVIDADRERALRLAQDRIGAFPDQFKRSYRDVLAMKLGLMQPRDSDWELAHSLLDAMALGEADFTLAFRYLSEAVLGPAHEAQFRALFRDPAGPVPFLALWRSRLAEDGGLALSERRDLLRRVNPAFVPRNHLIEEVIAAALGENDFAPFQTMVAVLARPFEDQPHSERYALPPTPAQRVAATFCGT